MALASLSFDTDKLIISRALGGATHVIDKFIFLFLFLPVISPRLLKESQPNFYADGRWAGVRNMGSNF